MFELFLVFILSVVLSAGLTFGIRAFMVRWRVLDIPNERSSHSQPTPTLGGLGIIFGVGGSLLLGHILFGLPNVPILQAIGFGTLIILILIYDEIRPLGRFSKLLVQILSSLIVMWAGVILHRIEIPVFGEINFDWAAFPITLLWLVGLQNIYNFMDGIDGIAGSEGFLVSGLICGLAFFLMPSLAPVCAAIAGGALGFLFFNFPPAKIFMGDVGSHFIGLSLASVAIWGETHHIPFWITALFSGVFIYDATYTLFRRLFQGENITLAHCTHIYQRLNRMNWSPLRVTIWFGTGTLMFGLVGYLYAFGFHSLAFWVLGIFVLLIVVGTVCLEYDWRTKHSEALKDK